jgi:hypothetical protein
MKEKMVFRDETLDTYFYSILLNEYHLNIMCPVLKYTAVIRYGIINLINYLLFT